MASVLLAGFWILMGVQTGEPRWVLAGAIISLIVFVFFLVKTGLANLYVSPQSLLFAFFSLILVIRNFWLTDLFGNLQLLLIASIGILFLIMGENLHKYPKVQKHILHSIVMASFGLAGLWITATIFGWGIEVFGPDSLVVYGSYYYNHNHLGDFLILAVLLLSLKHKRLAVLLLIPVIYSLSRSALLGLVIGFGYLVFNQAIKFKRKRSFVFLTVMMTLFFSLMSVNKVTLGSRQYFIQSLIGLSTFPLGVGFGNFSAISTSAYSSFFDNTDFSIYAHGLVFEWISGVGWLSIMGIGWLAFITWKMGATTKSLSKTLLRSLWWAMLIPMLLDTVYVIPSYWWLWMLVTGMAL